MSKTSSKYLVIALLLLFSFGVVVYGFSLYNNSLKEDLSLGASDTLTELTNQQQFNLYSKMSSDIKSIKNIAKAIRFIPQDKRDTIELLNKLDENTNFEYMLMTGLDGKGFASNGKEIDISKRSYFQSVIAGRTLLCNPMSSIYNDENTVVPIVTPILENDHVIGVLVGAYRVDNLNNLILPLYEGKGFAYVTDSSGNIILKPANEKQFCENYQGNNLLEILQQAVPIKYDNQEKIKNNMQEQKSGHMQFSIDGQKRLMNYAPLKINDWYIFMVIPESIISKQTNGIAEKSAILTISVLLFLFFLIFYILWQQRKSDKSRAEYLDNLERIAYFDELTELPNIYKFKSMARKILEQNTKKCFLIAKFDILNFRAINEMFGFDTGSQILQIVARYIQKSKELFEREFLVCARLNADEFIIIDEYSVSTAKISMYVNKFESMLNKEVSELLNGYKLEIRYGRYFLSKGEVDITQAIENANLAHRTIKENKLGKICDYNEDLRRQFMRIVEIENRMQSALDNEEFKVFLQGKFDLNSEKIVGAEALVRWQEKNGNYVLPGQFIPLFEKNGFVIKLDFYMFENVCKIIDKWIKADVEVVPISVNFSRMHLNSINFVEKLEAITNKYSVPRKFLEIEVTESIFFENERAMEELLISLHNAGFKLSMDDFGIGYSSLGLLKNLPVDVIKIDRSFFDNNKYKTRAKSVIESVMQMAKKLGIHTVAEGVENIEHIKLLKEVGCDMVQGFYYSKPMPANLFINSKNAVAVKSLQDNESQFELIKYFEEYVLKNNNSMITISAFEVYKLAIREILMKKYGEGEMLEVFRVCGELCGKVYAKQFLTPNKELEELVTDLKNFFDKENFGSLEAKPIDNQKREVIISIKPNSNVYEIPNTEKTSCWYNQGMVTGMLCQYVKENYSIIEIDCLEANKDICKFRIYFK
ncbi:MAG: EAL domain-containing protein [Aminipila sp.]